MAEIIMPKMGDAMTEGKVIRWYKKRGDSVKKGEPVLEIETDKVNLDLEAEETGTILEIRAEEGKMVPVGEALAIIGKEGEVAPPAAEGQKPEAPEKEDKPAEGEVKPEKEPAKEPAEASPEPAEKKTALGGEKSGTAAEPPPEAPAAQSTGARTKSSPLARKMAREMGVDVASLTGSGPAGRIIARDVQQSSAGSSAKAAPGAAAPESPAPAKASRAPRYRPPAALEQKDIPLSAMRRTIAKRLAESIGPIPHFFLTIDVDVTGLLSIREQFNQIEGVKVSVNDFVIRGCALSLRHHPMVNSSFTAEAIRQHGEVHVGIAVATPEGLITPVVRNADQKTIPDIATEVRSLAERARNRKLKPEDYQGGTFTISNLGMFGIEEFTAIINPPNAAILAVGAAGPRPVVVDGQIVVRERMKMTMSCDHRVVDGAVGAEFLSTLRQYLEQPLRLIL